MKDLIRQYVKYQILSEALSVVEKLKQQYPEDEQLIDYLRRIDPSHTGKYIVWMHKQIKNGARKEDVVSSISYYHKNYQKFAHKDIYKYDAKSLEDEVKLHAMKKSSKQTKQEGSELVYKDDRFSVYYVKNQDAVCKYGAGTRWCITMRDSEYFQQYTEEGAIFYFLIDNSKEPYDVSTKTGDPEYKIAFVVEDQDSITSCWNAPDDNVTKEIIDSDEYIKPINAIRNHAKTAVRQEIPLILQMMRALDNRNTNDFVKMLFERWREFSDVEIHTIVTEMSKLIEWGDFSHEYVLKIADFIFPKLEAHRQVTILLALAKSNVRKYWDNEKFIDTLISSTSEDVRSLFVRRLNNSGGKYPIQPSGWVLHHWIAVEPSWKIRVLLARNSFPGAPEKISLWDAEQDERVLRVLYKKFAQTQSGENYFHYLKVEDDPRKKVLMRRVYEGNE